MAPSCSIRPFQLTTLSSVRRQLARTRGDRREAVVLVVLVVGVEAAAAALAAVVARMPTGVKFLD